MGIYVPEQHAAYDGLFRLTGGNVFQVGRLDDASPWDHLGDDAANVSAVATPVKPAPTTQTSADLLPSSTG